MICEGKSHYCYLLFSIDLVSLVGNSLQDILPIL